MLTSIDFVFLQEPTGGLMGEKVLVCFVVYKKLSCFIWGGGRVSSSCRPNVYDFLGVALFFHIQLIDSGLKCHLCPFVSNFVFALFLCLIGPFKFDLFSKVSEYCLRR